MTFPDRSNTTHHSSLTGTPRAARQPTARALLVAIAAVLWFSPLALLAWLLGQLLIARQTRWHWHHVALGAVAGIAVVLVVSGPAEAIERHFFVPAQYVALHFGYGPPGTEISVAAFVRDVLVMQVWRRPRPAKVVAASWYSARNGSGISARVSGCPTHATRAALHRSERAPRRADQHDREQQRGATPIRIARSLPGRLVKVP